MGIYQKITFIIPHCGPHDHIRMIDNTCDISALQPFTCMGQDQPHFKQMKQGIGNYNSAGCVNIVTMVTKQQ